MLFLLCRETRISPNRDKDTSADCTAARVNIPSDQGVGGSNPSEGVTEFSRWKERHGGTIPPCRSFEQFLGWLRDFVARRAARGIPLWLRLAPPDLLNRPDQCMSPMNMLSRAVSWHLLLEQHTTLPVCSPVTSPSLCKTTISCGNAVPDSQSKSAFFGIFRALHKDDGR